MSNHDTNYFDYDLGGYCDGTWEIRATHVALRVEDRKPQAVIANFTSEASAYAAWEQMMEVAL